MSIIISPQGGMGNRLRAIASIVAIAKTINKDVYHYWVPTNSNAPFPHVKAMQNISLETLFDKSIPMCPPNIKPDICFSEWTPGYYWYEFQSSAQRHFGVQNVIQINDRIDSI